MLYKLIRFALLLSCVFVLGKSQVIPNATLTALVTSNLCNNISYAIGIFCLDDEQTYMLGFQSVEACEEVHDDLKALPQQNASLTVNECSARKELQATLNRETLKQVCENDEIDEIIYQQEEDLCQIIISTPDRSCHQLECVMNHHICDNLTEVEQIFKLEMLNEEQKYVVIFNETKTGRRRCTKTAKKLNDLPEGLQMRNITSTVHTENCKEYDLSCTLNFEGLKWVCGQDQITRVTFEEKYFNESICQNVTRAEHFFFSDDTEVAQFRVSYLTTTNAARDNCKKIVDGLQNPVTPGINATITIDDCDANSALIQGEFNYEALEFVCSCADPKEASVIQERETVDVGPIFIG